MEELLAENKLFNYADLVQMHSRTGALCFKLSVPIGLPPSQSQYPTSRSREFGIRVHEPEVESSQFCGVGGTKLRLQISVCPSQNDPSHHARPRPPAPGRHQPSTQTTQRGFLVTAELIEGDGNEIRQEYEYSHCIGQGGKFLEAKNVKFPADILQDVLNRASYPNRCLNGIISVVLLKPKREEIPVPNPDQMSITKSILSEHIQSDMSIIASNGSVVKCHKNFLAAHSTVLTAMFESKLKESKTGEIHMPDVSEAGVNAFLAYLYTWDLTEADKLSNIALELLEAGHKYNVYSLEEKMKNLFLLKGNDWYDVEIALKLFLFARNIEGYDDLKTRAVQVMKLNPKGMMQSKLFKKIFKKDSEAALELCGFAFLCLQ